MLNVELGKVKVLLDKSNVLAKSSPVMVPSLILPFVTALLASFASVTSEGSILPVVTEFAPNPLDGSFAKILHEF